MHPRNFSGEVRIALIDRMTSSINSSKSWGQLLAGRLRIIHYWRCWGKGSSFFKAGCAAGRPRRREGQRSFSRKGWQSWRAQSGFEWCGPTQSGWPRSVPSSPWAFFAPDAPAQGLKPSETPLRKRPPTPLRSLAERTPPFRDKDLPSEPLRAYLPDGRRSRTRSTSLCPKALLAIYPSARYATTNFRERERNQTGDHEQACSPGCLKPAGH